MTPVLRALAPAKVNLCLFLGPPRADGRHELVSLVQSVSLADELALGPAREGAAGDVVECPGVLGPNLAAAALAAFRARTGWDAPPQLLRIVKHVPVAGGMGGGSGDAAAALRLAAAKAGIEDEAVLLELARGLGADVPAQVRPGLAVVTGAGECVRFLPDAPPFGVLVLPAGEPLSTAAVFAEADRLGLPRDLAGLAERLAAVEGGAGPLPPELLVNELEPAACSLSPGIGGRLELARDAGADVAIVSGSGPTVVGLFWGPGGAAAARAAADGLAGRGGRPPAPVVAFPVGAAFAAPVALVRHNR